MSWRVANKCAGRRFGSAARKQIIMFLADRANDNGSGIWCSKGTFRRHTKGTSQAGGHPCVQHPLSDPRRHARSHLHRHWQTQSVNPGRGLGEVYLAVLVQGQNCFASIVAGFRPSASPVSTQSADCRMPEFWSWHLSQKPSSTKKFFLEQE
jgi:hypothetical protein